MSRESKTAINFDPYGVLDTVWKSDNDIGALCLDKNKKKLPTFRRFQTRVLRFKFRKF